MNTYFARHTKKMDVDQETRKRLWDGKWVAIHYPRDKGGRLPEHPENELGGTDNNSWNPDECSRNAQRPLRALKELAATGGFVCATYADYDHCLVGYIAPGSPLELIEGRRGNLHGEEGRQTFLKGVRFERAKEIDPRLHPSIFVGAPQQTTLTRWICVKSKIEDLVEGRASEPSIHTLSDAELETLCAEYLRSDDIKRLGLPRMTMLLLPVGRTMKGIDIYGLAEDDRPIVAQVTYGNSKSSQRHKEEVLRGYHSEGTHLVMFGKYDVAKEDDGILCCPIKMVYEYFNQTSNGQAWIHLPR